MQVSIDQKKIDELLKRRVVEVIIEQDLCKKLLSGKVLRVKLGADPTAPDIHLGHAVALQKLKEFQDLGHQIVFIIGDYTAKIGDPTGKSKTRPTLSDEEIRANAKTYLEQVGKILDIKKVEIRWNSEWFSKMDFNAILQLTANFTVARMIERDDFEKRLKEGSDIHMHELLYPMMQAYDSIMIDADVEIGGTDQKFNILAGRDLQRKMGKPEQDVLLVGPLLVGTDGVKKMSKSLGNYIGLSDAPEEMFGKIMSIPDSALWQYFTLVTHVAEEEITAMQNACSRGEMNPRDAKVVLAKAVVALYHSAEAAEAAFRHFEAVFTNKGTPENVPEFFTASGQRSILDILIETKLATSKTEARRLISEGGVKLDGKVVENIDATFSVSREGILLQKGKRHFLMIREK